MRKVRDYDAELKALGDKARALKAKKVEQLGELVTATGADALDAETLAGVLLDAVGSKDAEAKEAWRAKGAAFFHGAGARLATLLAATAKAASNRRGEAGEAPRAALIRGWVVQRRERTRHLIELGGLVQKAGLVELADDDRATSTARCSIWPDARGRIRPADRWRSGSGAASRIRRGSGGAGGLAMRLDDYRVMKRPDKKLESAWGLWSEKARAGSIFFRANSPPAKPSIICTAIAPGRTINEQPRYRNDPQPGPHARLCARHPRRSRNARRPMPRPAPISRSKAWTSPSANRPCSKCCAPKPCPPRHGHRPQATRSS
jgi:hypothetical protein